MQSWADYKDSRTSQRYNKRKGLLDDSPGYGLGADLAGALSLFQPQVEARRW
ncbi:hypothetical protein OG944_39185 (plasmid) [Streptomyces anulatus]|uniref:hypothetical protein n=1 Tax=Streptomyces anulatus TaxID=1892 RepID=UPI002F9170F7